VIDPVASRSAAYDALLHYLFRKNIFDRSTIDNNLDSFVTSLLIDMRSLCRHHKIDFDAAIEASAKQHADPT